MKKMRDSLPFSFIFKIVSKYMVLHAFSFRTKLPTHL